MTQKPIQDYQWVQTCVDYIGGVDLGDDTVSSLCVARLIRILGCLKMSMHVYFLGLCVVHYRHRPNTTLEFSLWYLQH